MIHMMERCHQQGPVVRMKMDRGCRDYSNAFQERIASAVVRKISATLRQYKQKDPIVGFEISTNSDHSVRKVKRKTQEISVELANGLSAKKASHCIGLKGENVQRCKAELQAILEKATDELCPRRPWESSFEMSA